jgi:Ca-activated chloride channel family protein
MPRAMVLAGILTLTGASLPAQDAPTVRVSTDLIHFGVTVTDKSGALVRGLAADDFEIIEDGRSQAIRAFAVGADTAPDLHVGLMFDLSESMLHDIDQARTAGIRFLNLIPTAADITLVDFAEKVSVARFSYTDFPWLVERIRTTKVDGMTALYDAFNIYLTGASENDGRSVLVAFTDGGDSRSRTRYSTVVNVARASQATVYIVGLLENQSDDLRGEAQLRLRRIAEETGGTAIFPLSMKQIDRAYDRILEEIRGQYSLGYVSSDTRRDGRWHSVRIRMRRPDLKDVRVRTRAGYYAPTAP